MSDTSSPSEPRDSALAGRARSKGSVSGGLVISSKALTYSETPTGHWDVQRARHELKVVATQSQLEIDAEEARHRRNQEAKDNDQRRTITYAVIGLVISAYIFTALVAILSENSGTQSQAWDIFGILIGALAGAIAGYFAGSNSK